MKKFITIFILLLSFSLFGEGKVIQFDSVSLQAVAYKPLGNYGDISSLSMGVIEQNNFTLFTSDDIRFLTRMGATYNIPLDDSFTSIYDLTFLLGGGWIFHPSEKLSLIPQFAAGLMLHHLTWESGNYSSTNIYADQYYSLSLQAGLNLGKETGRWELLFTPEVSVFPEQDDLGLLMGASLGLEYNL
ncbi:MAG: hypothetical protein PQJ59_15785 [Spirochaetales bacterium]|nr:hypothetical protein [Spirochaetales bacterium]